MKFQTQFNCSGNPDLKYAVLDFFKHESSLVLLDGNFHVNAIGNSSFDWAIAAGAAHELYAEESDAFEALQNFHQVHKDWIFGALSYDLKNGVEKLISNHPDGIQFEPLHFFVPKYLFLLKADCVSIYHHTNFKPFDFSLITAYDTDSADHQFTGVLKNRVTKDAYLSNVNLIKSHIQAGDIYEMNYCQEFYAEKTSLNPLHAFRVLNRLSKAPFSCFYKSKDAYLLSASPERFLKKNDSVLISQPIKGTKKRGATPEEDQLLKELLYKDQKERSENVMIVDLVRNDLARIAAKNSVTVDELFGIYSFEQVHQMISTVRCEQSPDSQLSDVFKATYPMGSMTGAPKISAMKLIEKFEITKRGLYSGSIGYITPTGDFDFNVVIRSIQYNAINEYLSFMVGGAITIGSDAEMEYQECLVKAKALFEVLQGNYAKTVS